MPVNMISVLVFQFSIWMSGNATPRWESISDYREFIDSSYRDMCFNVKAKDEIVNPRFTFSYQHSSSRRSDVNDVKRRKTFSTNVKTDHDVRKMNDYPSLPRSLRAYH